MDFKNATDLIPVPLPASLRRSGRETTRGVHA